MVRHADEGERRIRDVPDIFVQIVHLLTISHQNSVICGLRREVVGVILSHVWKGHVVAGADDNMVNVADRPAVSKSD